MPRTARITCDGAFYHVFNRGVNKAPIFFEDRDYEFFLRRLKELRTVKHYDHTVFFYVLMPNHFHMFIKTEKTPIAKVMSSLITSYSMYINRTQHKRGPVFESRYKSKMCDTDSYLIQVCRYIHMNPVIAGLVDAPWKYPWSSFGELFGTNARGIVDKVEAVKLLGDLDTERRYYEDVLISDLDVIKDIAAEVETFDREITGSRSFTTRAMHTFIRRQKKRHR